MLNTYEMGNPFEITKKKGYYKPLSVELIPIRRETILDRLQILNQHYLASIYSYNVTMWHGQVVGNDVANSCLS